MNADYKIFIHNTSFPMRGLAHPKIYYCPTDSSNPFGFAMYSTGLFIETDDNIIGIADKSSMFYSLDSFLERAQSVFRNCTFSLHGKTFSGLALYKYDDIMLVRLEGGRIVSLNTEAKYYDSYSFTYLDDAYEEKEKYPPEKVLEEMTQPVKIALVLEKVSKGEELTEYEKELVKDFPIKNSTISRFLLTHNYSYEDLKTQPDILREYYDAIKKSLGVISLTDNRIFVNIFDELDNILSTDPQLAILVVTGISEITIHERTISQVIDFLNEEDYPKARILQVVSYVTRYANILNENDTNDLKQ